MERRKSRGILLLLVLLAVVLVSYAMSSSARAGDIPYSQLRQYLTEQQVKTLSVRDTRLTGQLQDGTMFTCQLYSYDTFYDDFGGLIAQQVDAGILESYDCQPGSSTNWLQTLLPYVLAFLAFILLMNIMARMNGGAGGPVNDKMARFGEARIQDIPSDGKKVTFKDVAGADEEKEELEEIVQFLRDPERYTKLGAHIPKGVLLVGPPGTGKTLLAKAVAGEADVSFLSISGSDFVEMYVGVGASRVRDLFEQAKHQSPAIVFIDEIDAVGRQRGSGLGGGHDEREQTLNQLLVEMDGFTANEGVVVLAATNRVDILDPALLRPGRFDRQVFVGLPDIKGRRDILAIHAKGKPLAEDVDLTRVARATAGFTGADLENLLNEAALLTGRRGEKLITEDAIHQSVIKVIAGPEKHSRVIPEQERRLTAYHEAGHAVVIHALPHHDPVHQITIVPRGQSGGMTIFLPEEDRSYRSKSFMTEQIVSLLGGRAAEEMMLGDISTGASNDIQRASSLAHKMVATYGMSEKLGPVCFDSGSGEVFIGRTMSQSRSYSETVAAEIDAEVQAIIAESRGRCEAILTEQRDKLEAVAQYLLAHETMERADFLAVFGESEEKSAPESEN